MRRGYEPRLTDGLTGSCCTVPHSVLTFGGSEAGPTGAQTPDLARADPSHALTFGWAGPSLVLTPTSGFTGLSGMLPSCAGPSGALSTRLS